jgi:wyosine [tRNA(Phe)-imidazoG37] synthetase (radical SAM superfamily)
MTDFLMDPTRVFHSPFRVSTATQRSRSQVRQALAVADPLLVSLDAGEAGLHRKVNRPHPNAPFDRLLHGMTVFPEFYRGMLWVEVILVRGLNDSQQALPAIANAVGRIQPDAVHINLPTRPPAETWVEPPDEEGLVRATAILGDLAPEVRPAQGAFDLSGYEDIAYAVVAIITRHPMRLQELELAFSRWTPGRVAEALSSLEARGRVHVVERLGSRYWSAASAQYPEEKGSFRTVPRLRPRKQLDEGA